MSGSFIHMPVKKSIVSFLEETKDNFPASCASARVPDNWHRRKKEKKDEKSKPP